MKMIFYKGKGTWIDRLIRWWTGGKYSHCEIMFSDGLCFSSSSRDKGTRFKEIDMQFGHWDIVELHDVTIEEEDKIREWCKSKEGKPYDYLGLLGFVFFADFDDKKKYYCSEICLKAMEIIGRISYEKRVSPTYMRDLLVEHGYILEIG